MTTSRPRIAVIGAGIVGGAIAWHLAARGAMVILLDRDRPGRGVTQSAFAWINVAHGTPAPYARLRHLALDEYRRLERDLGPALRVDWCGALSWSRDPAATEQMVRQHAEWGYHVRLLDRAAVAALEPGLTDPPAVAAHAPGEGAVDPVAVTEILAAAAQAHGAVVRTGAPVLGLTTDDGRITGVRLGSGAGGETIAADTVVLAAGTGSAALCAPLGLDLPVAESPAILMRLRAPGPLVGRVVAGPEIEVRQTSRTGLLAAEDFIDDTPENGPAAVAERAMAAIRRNLRGGDGAVLTAVAVGVRPMPRDGLPIVGAVAGVPGLYLAAMHAGIVMAPTVGRLAAGEILDGAEADALAPCRLSRFLDREPPSP